VLSSQGSIPRAIISKSDAEMFSDLDLDVGADSKIITSSGTPFPPLK
jgi:hypothetical protein